MKWNSERNQNRNIMCNEKMMRKKEIESLGILKMCQHAHTSTHKNASTKNVEMKSGGK